MGTICRLTLPVSGRPRGILRCSARFRQRYKAASTNGMVLELDRRDHCRCLSLRM